MMILCEWQIGSKCWNAVIPPPLVSDQISPCEHTHAQRDTKKEGDKESESEREVFTEWPFWILSKGFASHYGDLENSPCSLIPVLFQPSEGIQWKLHSLN